MCLYGVYKLVRIRNPNQNKKQVSVDACIAEEIQLLNDSGIITLGCCCGHGKAGQITEYENGFGKWKERENPPHVLIDGNSVELAKSIGYMPYPFYYADGSSGEVWQMQLKSGCLTIKECWEWHQFNNLPYKKYLGIIA
jgi:hypothetical protein